MLNLINCFVTANIAAVVFSFTCGVIAVMFFKRCKKIQLSETAEMLRTKKNNQLMINPIVQKSRKNIGFLLMVSQRMSEDKKNLVKSLLRDMFEFQKKLYQAIVNKQSSSEAILKRILSQKNIKQEQHFNDSSERVESIRKNFLELQTELQELIGDDEMLKRMVHKTVSVHTQTGYESGEEVNENISINSIVTSLKELIENLESEARRKRTDIIANIYKFLDKNRKDIQQELSTFPSGSEEGYNEAKPTVIVEAEKMKNTFLGTLLLLDRQRISVENLNKRLKNFNRRFTYVAAKFDACWQQSNASCSNMEAQLDKSGKIISSTMMEMDGRSNYLIQQSKYIRCIISDMQHLFKYIPNITSTAISLQFQKLDRRVVDLFYNQVSPLLDRIEDYDQKMQDILLITEKTSRNLQSLTKESNKLEEMHFLVEIIEKNYGTFMDFLLTLCIEKVCKEYSLHPNDREVLNDEVKIESKDRNGIYNHSEG